MNPKQALTLLSHLSSREMEAVHCLSSRIEELRNVIEEIAIELANHVNGKKLNLEFLFKIIMEVRDEP